MRTARRLRRAAAGESPIVRGDPSAGVRVSWLIVVIVVLVLVVSAVAQRRRRAGGVIAARRRRGPR
jgi:hypothetical protein